MCCRSAVATLGGMAKRGTLRTPGGQLKKSDGEITHRIGRMVELLREAAGWSQNEVERRADLSVGTVCKLEKGRMLVVGIDPVVRLAEAFQVPIDLLVYGKVPKHLPQLPLFVSDDGEPPDAWAMARGGTRGARRILGERPPRGVVRPPKSAFVPSEPPPKKRSKAKTDR